MCSVKDDAISRSAMLQDLDAWRNQLGIYTGDDPHELELWETVGGMLVQFSDNVASAPTLDVAPVVHAKWAKAHGMMPPEYFGRHVCSHCDQFALNDKVGREKLSNWCPNCGAKMDLK